MTMTGGCACGALRYRAEGEPLAQGLCHCRTCQRLSGAGHTGFITFAESAVMLQGDTASYSSTGGSGRTATRYACRICHSGVFGRADVMAGKDPQLEKAIQIVMEELRKNPPKESRRPPFPVRAK